MAQRKPSVEELADKINKLDAVLGGTRTKVMDLSRAAAAMREAQDSLNSSTLATIEGIDQAQKALFVAIKGLSDRVRALEGPEVKADAKWPQAPLRVELPVKRQTIFFKSVTTDRALWPLVLKSFCFMSPLLFRQDGQWEQISKRTELRDDGVEIIVTRDNIDLGRYSAWKLMLGENEIARGPIEVSTTTHQPFIRLNVNRRDGSE